MGGFGWEDLEIIVEFSCGASRDSREGEGGGVVLMIKEHLTKISALNIEAKSKRQKQQMEIYGVWTPKS